MADTVDMLFEMFPGTPRERILRMVLDKPDRPLEAYIDTLLSMSSAEEHSASEPMSKKRPIGEISASASMVTFNPPTSSAAACPSEQVEKNNTVQFHNELQLARQRMAQKFQADLLAPAARTTAPSFQTQLKDVRKRWAQTYREQTGGGGRTMTISDLEQRKHMPNPFLAANVKDPLEQIGRRSLQLSNEFRKREGLSELTWSDHLHKVAKEHSDDMAAGKVPFSHANFQEKRVPAIAARSCAENVAYNYGADDVAKTAVDGWIESPGHRRNLLSAHSYCAIAVTRNSSGRYYLTQLFST